MRAGHFGAECVSGKFDVFMAKEALHLQIVRFAKYDVFLAMRAGNRLANVLGRKLDVAAAFRAGHFQETGGGIMSRGTLPGGGLPDGPRV